MSTASIVVEPAAGAPRMKLAAGGVLGDVNNDGRVNSADAVLLILYLSDPFDPTLPLQLGRTEVSLGSSIAASLPVGAVELYVILGFI